MIDPRYNQLLAALPATIYANWQPKLELVEMPLGKVLYESGSKLSHVYFPTSAIVSLLYVLEDGDSAEIAVVGLEGSLAFQFLWAVSRRPAAPLFRAPGSRFGSKLHH